MEFRQRIEQVSQVESTTPEVESTETRNIVEGKEDVAFGDKKDVDMPLDVWENENNRKYGVDYFNIREIANEFPLKAQFGAIDKFIKAEILARGLRNEKAMYEKVIGEIEGEIGTKDLNQYQRLQKIFNYIQVLQKYRSIKQKKESFIR